MRKKILEYLRNCCKRCLILLVTICLPILFILCVNSCSFHGDIMGVRITTKHDVCRQHIRQLAIAIQLYIDINEGVYPPPVTFDEEGKAMHSWRALILPYIDNVDKTFKYDYTVPWNHPNNVPLHDKMPIEFHCPCVSNGHKAHCESSYDMIFDFEKSGHIARRGSRKNLMLIEVFNTGVNWLQPVSIDIADISKGIKPFNDQIPSLRPGSKHPISKDDNKRYFFCVNDYGEVIELPTDITPILLEILAERDNMENGTQQNMIVE